MNVKIEQGAVRGMVAAIPSKSHLHRLLICAALADEPTKIYCQHTGAEDIAATVACLEVLGAQVIVLVDGFNVVPINIKDIPKQCVLPCRESGSTLRFLLPVVAALGVTATFAMQGRLPERPLFPLDEQLTKHGITLTRPNATTLRICGQLKAGNYELPGNVSSQYISGLLIALPLLKQDSKLAITGKIESADYLAITINVQREFRVLHDYTEQLYTINGSACYRSPQYTNVDGDWSNGAFWLACGAMPDCSITLNKIYQNSLQGDRLILAILSQLGAVVSRNEEQVTVTENQRQAVDIDAAAIPDLIPVVAAVLSTAIGTSKITNAGRLRIKESDRLATTASTLNALGAKIIELKDGLIIEGVSSLKGGTVDAHNDHRIAMCAAVASLACIEPVILTGAEAVNKSYPQLWFDFAKLGKNLMIEE